MRYFLSILLVVAGLAPAQARDLPNASYFVSGDVLPGMAERAIVPVFVHLQTGGDRMEWSFTTSYTPDETMCELRGKCHRTVQSLAYRVRWSDDGTLEILETERNDGEGMVIDRADLDGTFIYDAIGSLVDGGVLSLGANGGTLEGRAGRSAELIPATFDQLMTALSFSLHFGLSEAMLDHCVIRQVLNIGNDPSPDATHGEVLKAAAYMRWLEELMDQKRMASKSPIPQDMIADAEVAQKRFRMASFALGVLSLPTVEALLNGTALTDADLLAKATEAVADLRGQIGDDFDTLTAEVLTDRRDEFLAAVRIQARFLLGRREGRDPIAMLCGDVTLGG